MTRAEQDVVIERNKQRVRWGNDHDFAEHTDGALASAAAFMADPVDNGGCDARWAVALREKHKDDRRKQLVIAAALCIAEIERLDRA